MSTEDMGPSPTETMYGRNTEHHDAYNTDIGSSYVSTMNLSNVSYYYYEGSDHGLNLQGFYRYWSQTPDAAALEAMQLYLSPVLLFLGTLGNTISYLVLRQKLAKQKSVFFYMSLYAITNTLNLYLTCGLLWISHITETRHVPTLADWLCRIWQFVYYVIHYASTWLVVLMVFDRFIYLCIPSRAHSLCSVFTAKVLSCFVLIILIVISIHAMWTFELVDDQCVVDTARNDFQTNVWPIISAVIYIYLPLLLIITFDILIVINLAILNARQYQSRNFSPVQQQLTRVVLVISVTFLLLTLPLILLNVVDYFNPNFNTYETYAKMFKGNIICQFLLFVLCCLTFPQYFIPLPLFRKELVCGFRELTARKSRTSHESKGIEANGRLLHHDDNTDEKTNGITVVTKL